MLHWNMSKGALLEELVGLRKPLAEQRGHVVVDCS